VNGGALAGRRIVVTRPREDVRLRCLLEAEGAEVLELPAIRIAPPADYAALDGALSRIGEYAWIIFTSRNGVAAVIERLARRGAGPEALRGAQLAVIGPGTEDALRAHGLHAALSPAEFRAEALVEAFGRLRVRGLRMLLPRAEVARSVLPDGLRALGATVDVVAAYRTEPAVGQAPAVLAAVREGRVDAVTFTSSSAVRHFVRLAGPEGLQGAGRALVACIGPVTAETARESGLRVGAVAAAYTLRGLVDALRVALGGPAAAPRAGGRPVTSGGR
jgi:uroporphyrinogen III methyltransferase/synthase